MKNLKLKLMLVVAVATVSGAALASWNQPVYAPASVYNPATGHYEAGCAASFYQSYTGWGRTDIAPLLDGQSAWAAFQTVSCSSGYLSVTGDESVGYVDASGY